MPLWLLPLQHPPRPTLALTQGSASQANTGQLRDDSPGVVAHRDQKIELVPRPHLQRQVEAVALSLHLKTERRRDRPADHFLGPRHLQWPPPDGTGLCEWRSETAKHRAELLTACWGCPFPEAQISWAARAPLPHSHRDRIGCFPVAWTRLARREPRR